MSGGESALLHGEPGTSPVMSPEPRGTETRAPVPFNFDLRLSQFEADAPRTPPSTSSERGQVEMATETAKELSRARVLRMVSRLLLFGGIPIYLLILLTSNPRHSSGIWYFFEGMALLTATVGSTSSYFSLRGRRWLTTLGISLLAVGGLWHLGPLLGSGLIFVAAQLIASLLLGRMGGIIVISLLLGAMGLTTCFAFLEVDPLSFASARMGLSGPDWLRLSAVTLVGLGGIGLIFEKMQTDQWKAFSKEVASRIRERQLVAEREKVVRRAASLQRLESLGRLAGGIAHDFNNALVVLQCGIESLDDPSLVTKEKREIIRELAEAVERAGGTARQLLSFAKRNVEELGQCSPLEVLSRLRAESTRLVPAHIQLSMEIDATPDIAIAAPALEQLVLNLVQNARDALSDTPGTIDVTARTDRQTGGLHLTVADDGPGMDVEVADQAFEPFFTTKGDQGAGLGLATVWGIIRRHGGELSLDTEPGRGTRVHLYLPAVSETASTPDTPSPASVTLGSSQGARVLILEDEPPVRSALRRIFVHLGFEVVEAGTVEEARQACRRTSFRLLLSDGVVPDGGVGGFIQEFSYQFRGAPVILCSGYLEEDLALEGVARGKCTFLAKPFSVSELTSLLHTLLPSHFVRS